MKKRILIMFLLCSCAIGTLYALHITSNAPNRVPNGFNRNFVAIHGKIALIKDFGVSFRELAGIHGDTLFLMSDKPGRIHYTDTKLSYLSSIALQNPNIENVMPRFYTFVDYPTVYVMGGNAKAFAVGDLRTGTTRKVELQIDGIFNNPVYVDGHFVLQFVDNTTLNTEFIKINKHGNTINTGVNLPKSSRDGGMKRTGLLRNAGDGRLLYMHYLDNNIEVFDTNLAAYRLIHTVDTNRMSKVEVEYNQYGAAYKAPPITINGYCAVYDNILYVRSKLMADNEDRKDFNTKTIIDQYEIETGKYIGSFYLPTPDRKQFAEFYFIDQNTILAFSDNSVIIYTLTRDKRSLQRPIARGKAALRAMG